MPDANDVLSSSRLVSTRVDLHRVATHILARRRYAVTGRFGLRAGPGGITTSMFGDDREVIRIAESTIVRERGDSSSYVSLIGSTLQDLAVFADVDLDATFSCGDDAPELGDRDLVIGVDPDAMAVLAQWFDLGWRVLDAVLAGLPTEAEPKTLQLWPEHFDAGTDVGAVSGGQAQGRVNLGFSPGDGFAPEPYAYVGPWGPQRPGDPDFWNAPFGAVLRRSQIQGSPDPAEACGRFMRRGIELVRDA
jgi:hypothetical protein